MPWHEKNMPEHSLRIPGICHSRRVIPTERRFKNDSAISLQELRVALFQCDLFRGLPTKKKTDQLAPFKASLFRNFFAAIRPFFGCEQKDRRKEASVSWQ